jgi:hypothetical protein
VGALQKSLKSVNFRLCAHKLNITVSVHATVSSSCVLHLPLKGKISEDSRKLLSLVSHSAGLAQKADIYGPYASDNPRDNCPTSHFLRVTHATGSPQISPHDHEGIKASVSPGYHLLLHTSTAELTITHRISSTEPPRLQPTQTRFPYILLFSSSTSRCLDSSPTLPTQKTNPSPKQSSQRTS